MADLISWQGQPPALRRPVMLVALEGFVDAGAVGSTAAMFLRHRWRSEPVATFDREALIDYRARRPTVVVDSGRVRRLDWPEIELLAATVDAPHDAAFLVGPEPDMRWEGFGDAVIEACRRLDVEAVVTLGAYPAAVPHTRPTGVMRAGNALAAHLLTDVEGVAGYTGPTGAAPALQVLLEAGGIPATGLWAEVPHYLAGSPYPPGALELVRIAAATFGTSVDTGELEAAARLHREQVDEAVEEHEEARDMIAALERLVDSGQRSDDLPSGEDIAAEIERYLRTQQEG
jgi:predicted ATP-grasp superfamily ATP-dependent carboligase